MALLAPGEFSCSTFFPNKTANGDTRFLHDKRLAPFIWRLTGLLVQFYLLRGAFWRFRTPPLV